MATYLGQVLLECGDGHHRRRIGTPVGGRRQFSGRRVALRHGVVRTKHLRLEDFFFLLFLRLTFCHTKRKL